MTSVYTACLLTNLFCTFSMTGIIWFVQVVHYPLFASVGGQEFIHYEALHKRLTTLVVAPLMLLELGTSVFLPVLAANIPARILGFACLAIIVLIFASTAFVQVPLHDKLSSAYSAELVDRLVQSNWMRTILWTIKSILLSVLLAMLLSTIVGGKQ